MKRKSIADDVYDARKKIREIDPVLSDLQDYFNKVESNPAMKNLSINSSKTNWLFNILWTVAMFLAGGMAGWKYGSIVVTYLAAHF